jgi:hypothetical protein
MPAETGRSFRGLKAVANSRLSIMPAVIIAYRDVWRAFIAMRKLVVIALFIILATKVAEDFVWLRLGSGLVFNFFQDFAVGAVQIFFPHAIHDCGLSLHHSR